MRILFFDKETWTFVPFTTEHEDEVKAICFWKEFSREIKREYEMLRHPPRRFYLPDEDLLVCSGKIQAEHLRIIACDLLRFPTEQPDKIKYLLPGTWRKTLQELTQEG